MNPWIWLAILYQLIVYGKIVACVIVYVTLFQTWISTHGASGTPRLNLMKHKGPCKRSQHYRPTRRNIVGPNLLQAFAHHVVCCCMLLRLVGSCWMKFETGQTSEPTSANISIVSRSSKHGPTMLRSFAQHIQQFCADARALPRIHTNTCEQEIKWRRRWKTSQSPLYSHLKTQHVVTCCKHLHTSANIAQQETTLLGPTMLRVVASVCTGLNETVLFYALLDFMQLDYE